MNFVVISSFGTFQFPSFQAAHEAAWMTGGTCHRVYGRLNGRPVYGKAL